MHMRIHVCNWQYVYICIYTYILTYILIYTYRNIHTYVYIYVCVYVFISVHICIHMYIYIYAYHLWNLPVLICSLCFTLIFCSLLPSKAGSDFPLIWRLWMFECDESCFMYRYNDILWWYLQCFRLLYCVPCASMSQWIGFRLDFWSLVCLCMFLMFVSLVYFGRWGEHDPTGAMYDMNFMVHLGHLALRSPRQHYPCPICRRHLRAGAPE